MWISVTVGDRSRGTPTVKLQAMVTAYRYQTVSCEMGDPFYVRTLVNPNIVSVGDTSIMHITSQWNTPYDQFRRIIIKIYTMICVKAQLSL
jgi:hypothetical protein